MKKVSLKDIAAKVGVAPSTVSFVLNGKEKEMRISDALASRIRQVAAKAGYSPNKIAVSLRTGNSKILGLIVEDISNNFFASLAKVIEKEAERCGYNVVFCSTENDDKKGRELLRILSQQQVDGFLITPTAGMLEDVAALHKQHQPIVLMDRYYTELEVPCVLADNYEGVKDGVETLIKAGYKKIGFITVDQGLIQMKERQDGYRASLKKAGIKYNVANVLEVPMTSTQDEMVRAISKFITARAELDAIFFATNYLGIAGLESLKLLSKKIPDDLAIVCFDDHDIFRLYTPAITSLAQPVDAIGKKAVELLVGLIRQNAEKNKNNIYRFAAKLNERESIRQQKSFAKSV